MPPEADMYRQAYQPVRLSQPTYLHSPVSGYPYVTDYYYTKYACIRQNAVRFPVYVMACRHTGKRNRTGRRSSKATHTALRHGVFQAHTRNHLPFFPQTQNLSAGS